MLVSVLTSNLEVSFNLSTKDLQLLIDVDNQLLRAALKTSAKSSHVLLLLELGVCSIDFILKKKRILYLFHLLTVEGMPLVKQVFEKQLLKTTFGDWTKTVTKDLEDLNINLSFSQIASLSKQKFKMIVSASTKRTCFQYLLREKQKLSKGSEIQYTKFETQSYLKPGFGMSVENMRKIFHIRCREVFIKSNYPALFGDKKCPAPHAEIDQQSHVFDCSFFTKRNEIISPNLKYGDIFKDNVEKQMEVMKIFYAQLDLRTSYLTPQQPGVRAPADPSRVHGLRQVQRLGIKEAKQKKKKINKNKTRDLRN